jgi:hypothetical protein
LRDRCGTGQVSSVVPDGVMPRWPVRHDTRKNGTRYCHGAKAPEYVLQKKVV